MTENNVMNKLIREEDLGRDEARSLMLSIMSGELGHAKIAAILTALRLKGETVDEISGFVSAMREKAVRIRPGRDGLIDTCGTGGDARQTFNISTAVAIVAAGMGIAVAKHGNRAVSSRSGSADVLEALGVRIDVDPRLVAELVDRAGIGFMYAPLHHPAMKHVAPVRKELGIRTVFNLLGPLTNPAGVKRQLIGVFDKNLTEVVARVLGSLGSEKAFVVHGMDGTDEVSICGETIVSYLRNGRVHTMTFTPEEAGIPCSPIEEIGGGTAQENASHILDLLGGGNGARRNAVVLNAAFVALLADRAGNLTEGVKLARDAIDSGRAIEALENLRKASQELAARRELE